MSHRKGKTATPKVRRPRAELEEALRRRCRFLSSSSADFDAGDHDEAFRMAVELRALLHYGSAPPLLHELGLIKKIQFSDSCPPREPGVTTVWGGGLTILESRVQPGGQSAGAVVPRFHGPGVLTPRAYTSWWKSAPAVVSEDGKWHARHFLITEMANTESAHSDAYLNGDYDALRLRDSGWSVAGPDGIPHQVPSNVAAASVRQVAWEVLHTLNSQCPDLLN